MDEIDVEKLKDRFLEADTAARYADMHISTLRDENRHLREIIDRLLLTIQSFGNIKVDNHA